MPILDSVAGVDCDRPLDLGTGTPQAMPLLIIDELNGLKVKFNFLGERNVFGR